MRRSSVRLRQAALGSTGYLMPYQREDLIESCAWSHPNCGPLVRFLAMTGLRVGEAVALNTKNVRVWNGKGQVNTHRNWVAPTLGWPQAVTVASASRRNDSYKQGRTA